MDPENQIIKLLVTLMFIWLPPPLVNSRLNVPALFLLYNWLHGVSILGPEAHTHNTAPPYPHPPQPVWKEMQCSWKLEPPVMLALGPALEVADFNY